MNIDVSNIIKSEKEMKTNNYVTSSDNNIEITKENELISILNNNHDKTQD